MHAILLFSVLWIGAETGPAPIIAATFSGSELVIQPDSAKLKAAGLTLDQLKPLRYQRFSRENKWEAKIGGKTILLGTIAQVSERELQAPPFTVALPDGREARITPNAERISDYLVTGEFFEQDVRRALNSPWLVELQKTVVLQHIAVPGGHIPNAWGADHVHISIGEPLEKFATLEIHGQPGPQAAELQRMRGIRKQLDTAVELCKNMSRESFEKLFGQGKQGKADRDQHFKFTASTAYPLAPGHLELFFSEDGKSVTSAWASSEQPDPWGVSPNTAKLARQCADADRALLLAFLIRRYSGSDKKDKEALRGILEQSQADVQWTLPEREQLLGKTP